ncbi:helix-turn-helix domain-containing protein [Chryseobacterium viscerum]|uniref:helix-turn-helix domain-containing protein n=1 Tax=Chryseobacterium TaxID=59732 RepID=UPI0022219C16|nr:helix-turn-helix domain-containing protein [Chryseobacterium viscerum]MCW1963486.1 helix-turn-helix domain-containing protein [Chryseobacterium viscerum]WPO90800.1 helix-turn-helix domain-containing protein [Chryseobacterium sp. HR92]
MIPDYKQIYTDILEEKFPEKLIDAAIRLKLETLHSAFDILKFNQMIFGEPEYVVGFNNQRLRSYDEESILKILRYQKQNELTNLQLGKQFKISRNTIAKWKTIFKV